MRMLREALVGLWGVGAALLLMGAAQNALIRWLPTRPAWDSSLGAIMQRMDRRIGPLAWRAGLALIVGASAGFLATALLD